MHDDPTPSNPPLTVYIDVKSPHAYLALGPTRQLARELGIRVDWRPMTPDFSRLLGSARLGNDGQVIDEDRSPEQWRAVKAFYLDCRRYASLHGITLLGTVKIWDTHVAGFGMSWAKRQGPDVLERYLDLMFVPFWRRELDIEQPAVIRAALERAGADVTGFDAALERGVAEAQAEQEAARAAGVFGVPTYVVGSERYFGREHLPRIRWQLTGCKGAAPDVAYTLPPDAAVEPATRLEVCVDFKCPYSYLAVEPTLALASDLGVEPLWRFKMRSPFGTQLPVPKASEQAQWYRETRGAYDLHDIERYAPHPVDVERGGLDSTAAAIGLLWLQRQAPGQVGPYVQAVFRGRWRDRAELVSFAQIRELLDGLSVAADDFLRFAHVEGTAALERSDAALLERGVFATPTFLLDDEPFIGRQHLPLLRRRLAAGLRLARAATDDAQRGPRRA